jgi:hypothetical protein
MLELLAVDVDVVVEVTVTILGILGITVSIPLLGKK